MGIDKVFKFCKIMGVSVTMYKDHLIVLNGTVVKEDRVKELTCKFLEEEKVDLRVDNDNKWYCEKGETVSESFDKPVDAIIDMAIKMRGST